MCFRIPFLLSLLISFKGYFMYNKVGSGAIEVYLVQVKVFVICTSTHKVFDDPSFFFFSCFHIM